MKKKKVPTKKKIVKEITGKRGISLKDRYAVIDLKQALLLIETMAAELENKLTVIIRKDNYWNRRDLETIEAAKKFSAKFRRS